jgi:L-idonate 5-dehydrogenase
MQAFYLHGARDLRPTEIDPPQIASDEVLVRVRATGICGSDLHYYLHGKNGDFVPERPFVLGHESAGEVADPGAFPDALPLGSRVAIDPSHPCRACTYCREGRYNLCPHMRYFGSAACSPPQDGSFREYVPVRAENCHLLPEAMDFRHAALLEPLSIAIHGIGQAGTIAGKSALITGAGPIGQLLGLVARHYGAARLAVSDIRQDALDLATALWADTPLRADDPAQVAEAVGDGFDIVIEASGAAPALQTAYEHCKPGGTLVQLGVQAGMTSLPVNLVMQKELTVRGSFRFAHVFDRALDLLARQQLDIAPLISQCFDFADLVAGFDAALQPRTIKVVIDY